MSRAYMDCVEALRRCRAQGRREDAGEGGVALDERETRLFIEWFNELLSMGKEWLVRQVFGTSVPSIGDLRVVGYWAPRKTSSRPLLVKLQRPESCCCLHR